MNIVAVLWDVKSDEGVYLGYVEQTAEEAFDATAPDGRSEPFLSLVAAARWCLYYEPSGDAPPRAGDRKGDIE